MKHLTRKFTTWQVAIGVPAAMLFFVLSAQAQQTITAASNPVVVPNGQASATTTITWKAAPDYTYSEIYLSVDNGQWSEFARGADSSKPATIKLGSSYTFRMMIYEGQAGTPKVITSLTVTAVQGNPPPPGSGSGRRILSDTVDQKNPRGDVLVNLLNIRNVQVSPGPRRVVIKFNGPPNQVPFVAIGRGEPIMKNGEWSFGDNQVGGGFAGPNTVSAAEKAKGQYTFASAFSSLSDDVLEPGATYHYIISVSAPAGSGRRTYQDTDSFTTTTVRDDAALPLIGGPGGGQFTARCPQGQLLAGVELRTGDDVDAIRPLCVTAFGPAAVGPLEPGGIWFGGNGGLRMRRLVCSSNAPIVTGMYVYAVGRTEIVDGIHLFCGTASPTQEPSQVAAASFDGSGGNNGSGLLAPFSAEESDTQRCPAGLVAVGINGRSGVWLDAVGLICGEPELTPRFTGNSGNSENTGTTSSALKTERPVVKTLGRVKSPPTPGTTPGPPKSICDLAREARARNSPTAPALEERCRAAGAAGERPQTIKKP